LAGPRAHQSEDFAALKGLSAYTAQRRGDVVRIGRQHIRDGVLTIRQQKTGAMLAIPVHRELAAIIAATPAGHLTLLTTKNDKSYDANVFSDEFRSWCNAAGLPQRCVFHGLRKAALTRLADAQCTTHEIAAISGHKSPEVERYTKRADQVRLARAAMERIANESVKPDPSEVSKSLTQLMNKVG
jgi:integrase